MYAYEYEQLYKQYVAKGNLAMEKCDYADAREWYRSARSFKLDMRLKRGWDPSLAMREYKRSVEQGTM